MFGEDCDPKTIVVEVSKCLIQIWHQCLFFVYGPRTQGSEEGFHTEKFGADLPF